MPVSILPTPRGPSAFLYPDPEGAPGSTGRRYHAAVDWFAKGGTVVRSPCAGQVVEVRHSGGDRYGQVFGGTVKVRERDGTRVYVMRHSEPLVGLAVAVEAGQPLATVTDWADRPSASHVHLEVWRSLAGGYRLANMVDPGTLTWGPYGPPEPPGPPRPPGGTLRLALPGKPLLAGWDECVGPLRWIAAHRLRHDRAVLTWQRRRFTTGRRITGVARYFAEKGWLT